MTIASTQAQVKRFSGSAPTPLDRTLVVTVYPGLLRTKEPEQLLCSWPELVDYCRIPAPLPPGGKEALAFWHGAELAPGGARRNSDVIATHVLFLDVDRCPTCAQLKTARNNCHLCGTALQDAMAHLGSWGIVAAAFPSPSGKPNRGRILIPLAKPVSAEEHKQLWRICNARLGGNLDRQCIAPSHGFFIPAIADASKWWIREFNGFVLDPADFDLRAVEKPIRAPTDDELLAFDYATRMREVLLYAKQLQSAQKGQRHARLFKLAQVCLDYALTEDEMRRVVLDYNSSCEDPKPAEVVERDVISKAARYRRNAVGCALTAAVKVHTDHLRTLERMLELLREHVEDLYVREGALCELIEDGKSGGKFVEVERPRLHSLLTRYVQCYTWDGKKEEWHKGAIPPWAAEEILSMPNLDRYLRPAKGIASAPTLRPDGSVLCAQGWDSATQLVYMGEPIDLPFAPTKEDAERELSFVESLFAQFPWDGAVSKAVHTAYLLTAVARTFIDGPVPIGIFDATHKQSGKSKLAGCIGIVATGALPNSDIWPTKSGQMQEVLHTRCVADGRIVLFDNVKNGSTLESAELDGALTQRKVGRRRYFTQQPWDLPFDAIVLVTGNGISIGGDLRPRSLYVRLTPVRDNPEQRSDLEIPDLFGFVERNRQDICKSLLTVWLAWLRAGQPGDVTPWHTVAAWASVRKVLVWLGRPDPMLCRTELTARDAGAELHSRLLEWVEANGPLTAHGLLETLLPKSFGFGGTKNGHANGAAALAPDAKAELWAAICQETRKKSSEITTYEIGWILRRHRDAPLGGKYLRKDEKGKWYVETANGAAAEANGVAVYSGASL